MANNHIPGRPPESGRRGGPSPWARPEGSGGPPGGGGPGTPGRGPRWGLWFIMVAGLALLLIVLNNAFPDAIGNSADNSGLIYPIVLILTIGSLWVLRSRVPLTRGVKHASIWVAIFAGLFLATTMLEDISGVRFTASGRLATSAITESGDEFWIERADDGHFYVPLRINGANVNFLVDTGASLVAFSRRDAKRIGYDPDDSDFIGIASTANGEARFAPFLIDEIKVGDIVYTNVAAAVMDGGMEISLLGMSFLERLSSHEMRGNRLILRP